MAFRWRADDDPLIVVLGSSLPSSTKKTKKKLYQNWTPLTELSGSAHRDFVICQHALCGEYVCYVMLMMSS